MNTHEKNHVRKMNELQSKYQILNRMFWTNLYISLYYIENINVFTHTPSIPMISIEIRADRTKYIGFLYILHF